MSTSIMERILASSNLPSIPLVAIKVLELTHQEDVGVEAIANVIQKDPALAAKLLQTANSPFFGVAKKVGSIQQATVVLGLRSVKIMALSFSLVDSLRKTKGGEFDYRLYWRRSLTAAAVSKLLARHCPEARADECFVGGLLADIGMLAACQCANDLYRPVLRQFATRPRPFQDIETEMLGLTHAQISSALLHKWSLPDMLCEAVAAHHGAGLEALEPRTRMLASVMYASASIAEVFCGDVSGGQLDEVKGHCLKLIPITPDALEQILDDLHTSVNEMAALFQLEIGPSVSYEALRTQAVVQPANISLAAEMDRAAAADRAAQAQREIQQLSVQAATDGLTNLANRRAFDAQLCQTLEQAQREGSTVGLIMLDIDHFKRLNDTYGHQAGDKALRQVGQCLKAICTDTVMAARYGGEEFAVVVAETTARSLRQMAEDIRSGIEKIHFEHEHRPIRLTASLGVAHINLKLETTTPAELVERADECLYDAKHYGRNRVEITF